MPTTSLGFTNCFHADSGSGTSSRVVTAWSSISCKTWNRGCPWLSRTCLSRISTTRLFSLVLAEDLPISGNPMRLPMATQELARIKSRRVMTFFSLGICPNPLCGYQLLSGPLRLVQGRWSARSHRKQSRPCTKTCQNAPSFGRG